MEFIKKHTQNYRLNHVIRSKQITTTDYTDIMAIINVINNSPKYSNILYRGIDQSKPIKIGDIIEDYGFMSKSILIYNAEVFCQQEPYTILELIYPEPYRGFFVLEYETEIVTYPGEIFEVVGCRKHGKANNFIIYTCEYIGNLYDKNFDEILPNK